MSGTPPTVSVIVPAYNVEMFISECIRSVLDQTFTDIEIIAIDDGSTDRTGAILDEIAAEANGHGIIMQVIHQRNGGEYVARKAGLQLAQGAYVALLDGDDRWLPQKLERQVAMIERRPDLDLLFCGFRVIDERGVPTGFIDNPSEVTLSFEDVFCKGGIGSCTLLLGRRAVMLAAFPDGPFTSNFDRYLALRTTMMRPNNIGSIGEVLAEYRKRPGQLTGNWRKDGEDWEKIVEIYRRQRPDLARLVGPARAVKYQHLASNAYALGDYAAARRLAAVSWQESPATLLRWPGAMRRSLQYLLLPLVPDQLRQHLIAAVRTARRAHSQKWP